MDIYNLIVPLEVEISIGCPPVSLLFKFRKATDLSTIIPTSASVEYKKTNHNDTVITQNLNPKEHLKKKTMYINGTSVDGLSRKRKHEQFGDMDQELYNLGKYKKPDRNFFPQKNYD